MSVVKADSQMRPCPVRSGLAVWVVAVVVVLVTGCAGDGVVRPGADPETLAEVDAVLTDADYVTSQHCLALHEYTRVEILDDQRLLFHGRGDRLWLNQLRTPCTGLRRHSALQFEPRSGRVCNLDVVREYDPYRFGGRTGSGCSLGDFEEIPAAQAVLLRELLQAR